MLDLKTRNFNLLISATSACAVVGCVVWQIKHKKKVFSYHHEKLESHHHMKKRGRRCPIPGCVPADSGTLYGPKNTRNNGLVDVATTYFISRSNVNVLLSNNRHV